MTDQNQQDRDDQFEGEVVDTTALATLTRSEIDVQIATAHRYPRSVHRANQNALTMATLDQATAASMSYALPRKAQDGSNKAITGPSVRLAEIYATCWGNIRVAARIIEDAEKYVTAQGICHDLETNLAVTTEVRRRVTGRNGKRYSDDMVIVTMNAALAIARRNAIFQVVPRVYIEQVRNKAVAVSVGDEKSFDQNRKKLIGAICHFGGISEARVLAAINRQGIQDVTVADVQLLNGFCQAIKEGTTTVLECFPDVDPTKNPVNAEPVPPKSKAADLTNKVTNGGKPAAAANASPQPSPESTGGEAPVQGDSEGEGNPTTQTQNPPAEHQNPLGDAGNAASTAGAPGEGKGEGEGERKAANTSSDPAGEATSPAAAADDPTDVPIELESSEAEIIAYIVSKRPRATWPDVTKAKDAAMKRWAVKFGKKRWPQLNEDERRAVIAKVDAGEFPWQ